MPNISTQIYIQTLFAVRNRNALIQPSWEEELYKYITAIVKNKEQKMLALNGIHNHIHPLIGIKPTGCLSDLVIKIKKSSTAFVKEKQSTTKSIQWQEGFGAISPSHSQLHDDIQYIVSPKEHHRKRTIREKKPRIAQNL